MSGDFVRALPRFSAMAAALILIAFARNASAVIVGGGGSRTLDCVTVFDAPGANSPEAPKPPRNIDCTDGDSDCDADMERNGRCIFDLTVCINSTAIADCAPGSTNSVEVDHAVDDGKDSKFDPDFLAIQQRVDLLGFPGNTDADSCTATSAITVPLRAPSSGNIFRRNRKRLSLTAIGLASGRATSDRDKMKLTCEPEGDGAYSPIELYDGTFDRIRQQIFAQSCAMAGCHDSESHMGDLILLPNVAYSQIVNHTSDNPAAAADGLLRITPGDEQMSLLYRKIEHTAFPDYGPDMPLNAPRLSDELIELVRLWIIGDMTWGPAPEEHWVEGTDQ